MLVVVVIVGTVNSFVGDIVVVGEMVLSCFSGDNDGILVGDDGIVVHLNVAEMVMLLMFVLIIKQ
jgi:hypothetical protein